MDTLTQSDLRSLATAAPERLYVDWVRIPDHDIEVTAQSVRLDGPDGCFPMVDALTTQRFADMLDAFPVTAAMVDLIWKHAEVRLPPHCLTHNGSWKQGMEWSDWARAKLTKLGVGPGTLCYLADKVWTPDNDPAPGMVWEYGILVPADDCQHEDGLIKWGGMETRATVTPTDARAVQWLMDGHNFVHADYMMHGRFWRPIDGVSPEQALVTHDGKPLHSVRIA